MAGPDIPTYEEATSSRHNAEGGVPEERAQLLRQSPYRQPTAESVRSSLESSFLDGYSAHSSVESLQREMIQMDIEESPDSQPSSSRRLAYRNLSKRFSTFTNTISSSFSSFSFRWPCKISFPRISCGGYAGTLLPYYRIIAVIFAIFLIYVLLASGMFNFRSGALVGQLFEPSSVQRYAFEQLDKTKIQRHLEHLTRFGHVAGTEGDLVLAKYVKGEFTSFGLDAVEEQEYHVYMNYPKKEGGRKVAIIAPPELAWEVSLEEKSPPGAENPPVFHGYSRSGDVKGPLIYGNYGTRKDFSELAANGVNITGAVVLMKHGGPQPDAGMKVKAAELAGAIGCILYNDGVEDGVRTNREYPEHGINELDDYVQRGSVAMMSHMVGDVLTPGYASTMEAPRIAKDDNPALPNIPSLPISWRNANKLIESLKGHGAEITIPWEKVPRKWWTGNSTSPTVHLVNELVDQDKHPIWNVLGLVRGLEQSEKKVIIGNHRDSWCYGAASPNSGTAVMLEVARIFGEMAGLGWRPLRSVIFASWDGGTYNRIGSTEWVEDHKDELRHNGIAYVNLATAVSGARFRAAGSPPLETMLLDILGRIEDASQNLTLRELWGDEKLPGLGASSDYAAFQHHAGVCSIDIGFHGEYFPYQSCYDTFESAISYDPNMDRHHMIAQVAALLILELADTANMPFNLTNYAQQTALRLDELEAYVNEKINASTVKPAPTLDLKQLRSAVEVMNTNLYNFENLPGDWKAATTQEVDLESPVAAIHRMSHNSRMANFEHHLLDMDGGAPGREWYKHVLMAPQKWNGWEPEYFPSIKDYIEEEGDWVKAQEQVEKVAKRIVAASEKLLD